MSASIGRAGRAALLLLVTVLVVAFQWVSSAPARSAVLGGVFTNVQITPGEATPTDHMQVDAAFTIPSGSRAGDTFSLGLSAPFVWVNDDFDIKDPNTGEVVAHVTVAGGTATFTLTDYVEGRGPISGKARFFTFFQDGSVQDGDVVEATFTTKDETFRDEVNVVSETTRNPPNRKEFRWTDRELQNGFSFAIFATTLNSVPDANRTVTITDTPSDGVQVTCSTLTVQMAPDVAGVPGAFTPVRVANRTVTCPSPSSPNGFTVEARQIPPNYHVRVRGKAVITDATLSSYTNVATISIYGKAPIRVTNSVRRYNGSGDASGDLLTTTTTSTSSTSTTSTSSTSTTSTSSTSTTSTSSTSTTTTPSSSTTTTPSTSSTTTTPSTSSTTTTTPPTTTTTSSPSLPSTGVTHDPVLPAGIGALLVGLGFVLVFGMRRRPSQTQTGRYRI